MMKLKNRLLYLDYFENRYKRIIIVEIIFFVLIAVKHKLVGFGYKQRLTGVSGSMSWSELFGIIPELFLFSFFFLAIYVYLDYSDYKKKKSKDNN